MNILLIDADSTIPNLALMKLARFHKNKLDKVSLVELHIPYYPNRKRVVHEIDTSKFDVVYCSSIFDGSSGYVKGNNIVFGGTGHSLDVTLPDDIEHLQPDYSVYPDNDTSYGFISRGCIRKCSFCKVPKKEGYIRQVTRIDDIVQHKKVKFLDNNFLALPNRVELLEELRSKNIRHQFNQGLDIRLVDAEIGQLLSQLNYMGEYIFAFDDIKQRGMVEKGLELLQWRKDWQFKFFVYIHPRMELADTVRRIEWLRERKCLPYIMRDISCWGSEYQDFYTDIAAWCNQVGLFKKLDYGDFLVKRHLSSEQRIDSSSRLYNTNR